MHIICDSLESSGRGFIFKLRSNNEVLAVKQFKVPQENWNPYKISTLQQSASWV